LNNTLIPPTSLIPIPILTKCIVAWMSGRWISESCCRSQSIQRTLKNKSRPRGSGSLGQMSTPLPPTEFVMCDHSRNPCYFP
jgi:hypothetical protein